MTRIVPVVVLSLLLLVAASAAAAAPASPRTVPGWPKAIPAGTVLQGPGGGLVVAWQGESGFTVRAYRRDGRRLWSTTRDPDCGNCDDGPQPEVLQADGTYGPIGYEGDDFWAVDARGRRVAGCAGVVFADGACVAGGYRVAAPDFIGTPVMEGRSGDGSWVDGDDAWTWSADAPPMTVRDAAGIVYTAFLQPVRRGTTSPVPGLLMAVDPAARTILWTRVGPTEVLTGLDAGVLVSEAEGIAAIGRDGATRWARPLPPGQRVDPADTAYDAPRGRVYIGRTGTASPGVTALEAGTGRQLWRTRPVERARLLSVGRGGRVYVAVDRPGRRAVRGLRLTDGRTAWQRRTSARVLSARELVNGTVAVSAGERFGHGSEDRLTLLDPR